eukprot:6187148-Pleurochrysis_carterae.AAC.1
MLPLSALVAERGPGIHSVANGLRFLRLSEACTVAKTQALPGGARPVEVQLLVVGIWLSLYHERSVSFKINSTNLAARTPRGPAPKYRAPGARLSPARRATLQRSQGYTCRTCAYSPNQIN